MSRRLTEETRRAVAASVETIGRRYGADEDIRQAAWLAAAEARTAETSARYWRVVVRRAMAEEAGRARAVVTLAEKQLRRAGEFAARVALDDAHVATTTTPEDHAIYLNLCALVDRALATLSPVDRDLMTARIVTGGELREIAASAGVPARRCYDAAYRLRQACLRSPAIREHLSNA